MTSSKPHPKLVEFLGFTPDYGPNKSYPFWWIPEHWWGKPDNDGIETNLKCNGKRPCTKKRCNRIVHWDNICQ